MPAATTRAAPRRPPQGRGVERSRDRVPVLFLHATGETADDWNEVAGLLRTTRAVYGVDLRGHGDSDWPGSYSIEAMGSDAARLLEHFGGPMDLVGHSLGGLVACRAAHLVPNLVRRLVLEDVGVLHPAIPGNAGPSGRAVGVRLGADPAHTRRNRRAGSRVAVPVLRHPLSHSHHRRWAYQPGFPGACRRARALLQNGHSTALDTGHFVHETAPVEFTDRVRAFLDR